jgi:hypothetical protein
MEYWGFSLYLFPFCLTVGIYNDETQLQILSLLEI